MKKIIIEINHYDYRNLKELLLMQEKLIKEGTFLLSGTKMIRYEFVVISFLYERYLFAPDVEQIEQSGRTSYSFYIFQAAELFYFLQDTENLPFGLQKTKDLLAKKLFKYMPDRSKSEFQKYYETQLMDEYHVSYTELRDELPEIHNSLQKMYENLICLV